MAYTQYMEEIFSNIPCMVPDSSKITIQLVTTGPDCQRNVEYMGIQHPGNIKDRKVNKYSFGIKSRTTV